MKRVGVALRLAAVAGLIAGIAAGCANTGGETPPGPVFSQPFTPLDASAQVADMTRGVNVLGYDPYWNDAAQARFKTTFFGNIHRAGFSTVRVVLQSFSHMDKDNQLDPVWLHKLDVMVEAAVGAGLNVILDEHDFELCGADAVQCRIKVNAFWSQIAPRYRNAPSNVMFEILNEPNKAMTPEIWNAEYHQALGIIRQTNPTRNVVIGPSFWNGLEHLGDLDLPAGDQHIIVTFHYYHPMPFTHQGAAWAPPEIQKMSNLHWGSEADYALLNKEFDVVKAWSDAHHRPIFLGEFGAYDKAPLEDRVKWDSAVARAAEARGFAWGYWQFDSDFVLWDYKTNNWVHPILDALIPQPAK